MEKSQVKCQLADHFPSDNYTDDGIDGFEVLSSEKTQRVLNMGK